MDGLRIIGLDVANVKRIRAIKIALPDEPVVLIGGRNGQGKTSLLDAIVYAMGGRDEQPTEPVRRGEEAARSQVVLGRDGKPVYTVLREWKGAGQTLKVFDATGGSITSPQRFLDSLIGSRIAFDPLQFARMDAGAQAKTLANIAGVDVVAYARQRKTLYDQRTDVNREADRLGKALQTRPALTHARPEAVEGLLAEQRRIRNEADAVKARNAAREAERERRRTADSALDREQERLMLRINEIREEVKKNQAAFVAIGPDEPALPDSTLAAIDARIADAQKAARDADQDRATIKMGEDAQAAREHSERITGAINAIDAERDAAMAAAPLPIQGLTIDPERGVLFGGVPFAQCSLAEQTRVSAAIGMAGDPEIRVMLVRDGSLLDADSMASLARMAGDAGYQILVERVGAGDAGAIVIEDGEVAE